LGNRFDLHFFNYIRHDTSAFGMAIQIHRWR
jgi:hypothetical protein